MCDSSTCNSFLLEFFFKVNNFFFTFLLVRFFRLIYLKLSIYRIYIISVQEGATDKEKLPISYHYNAAILFIIARESDRAPKCNSCQYLHMLQARLVVLVG